MSLVILQVLEGTWKYLWYLQELSFHILLTKIQ
jgi:hypothetical protein